MTVIGELLGGATLDVALRGIAGGVRAFLRQDNLGRLLVLLHGDFGDSTELGRDAFFAWRADQELERSLRAVLGGLPPGVSEKQELAALIAPHLLRTEPAGQAALAAEIAQAAFDAAPYAAEGGSQAVALIVQRLEGGQGAILTAVGQLADRDASPASDLAKALVVGPLGHIDAVEDVEAAEALAGEGRHREAAEALLNVGCDGSAHRSSLSQCVGWILEGLRNSPPSRKFPGHHYDLGEAR